MARRHFTAAVPAFGIALLFLFAASCGDDTSSTKPGDGDSEHLAGGGRDQGDDPFAGGPDGSGPTRPDFEYPEPGFAPLFYAETDCSETPGTAVIRTAEEWNGWWDAATACLGGGGDGSGGNGDGTGGGNGSGNGNGSGGHGSEPGGGGDPDSLYPWPAEPPPVDFSTDVVIAIRLAADEAYGRGVWVSAVEPSETGTAIRYQVTSLGDDCFDGRDPAGSGTTSPTIAVAVPRPVDEPVRWEREEIVYSCSWEPDPNRPLALYYTDADCDLGEGETVIRDADRFDAWLEQAFACDQARWGEYDSTVVGPGTGTGPRPRFGGGYRDSVPPEPIPPGPVPPMPPPAWIGIEVDFTRYAVLILRADPQARWGGGIWLDGIEASESGTTIDYTVMAPSGECPPVETGEVLRPTVAIRVLLPVDGPVTWNRRTETIECGWRDGGPIDNTGTTTPPFAYRQRSSISASRRP